MRMRGFPTDHGARARQSVSPSHFGRVLYSGKLVDYRSRAGCTDTESKSTQKVHARLHDPLDVRAAKYQSWRPSTYL